jgi:hypothetical protein
MSYRMFVPSAKALKSSAPKSGKSSAFTTVDMSVPLLSAKSTKFLADAEEMVDNDLYSTKSGKADHVFGRVLGELDSMSYSNVIIAGKSAKLQPKSGKKETPTVKSEENRSSKAGKSDVKITVRSIDPSFDAIDFTRSAMPQVASATAEESSSTVATVTGSFAVCILVASYLVI